MHGHSDKWDSKDIYQRFGYQYSAQELTEWAGKIRGLAGGADLTHVLFNNCYRNYAQVNAQELAEDLGTLLVLYITYLAGGLPLIASAVPAVVERAE
jgi:uncharacterized protein YecE (DUF72 family)